MNFLDGLPTSHPAPYLSLEYSLQPMGLKKIKELTIAATLEPSTECSCISIIPSNVTNWRNKSIDALLSCTLNNRDVFTVYNDVRIGYVSCLNITMIAGSGI
jgi:hypothetical protein